MINEKEILWNQTLKLRNELQQWCLKRKHSYQEEIKIKVPDGMTIETVIGGRNNGQIIWSLISPEDDFVARIQSHFNTVQASYERYGDQIIKDVA